MSASTKLVPCVEIRENVKINIKTLTRPERRELDSAISKLLKSSIFVVERKLDQYVRIQTDKGVVVYGTIIRRAFFALVRISQRRLQLLSVVDIGRLLRSRKTPSCALVNDFETRNSRPIHVFAGIDNAKRLVWRWETRPDCMMNGLKFGGALIVPFPMR